VKGNQVVVAGGTKNRSAFFSLFSLSHWIQMTHMLLFSLQLLAFQFFILFFEKQSQDVCIRLQLILFQNPIQMNKTQLMNRE